MGFMSCNKAEIRRELSYPRAIVARCHDAVLDKWHEKRWEVPDMRPWSEVDLQPALQWIVSEMMQLEM